ncbi:metal-dependent hydrolase [Povalibacter sp.]|uniref:metal-dependent hydrolase n=1 Tax=Povalibacter sp. TaxID=1962978 RepID=UPI002F413B79
MDNFTHTLAGVLVGETLAQVTSPSPNGLSQQQRRNLLVTLMAVGSNLPDLDFLSSAFQGGKLDYLIEHRGHTHTVIGALVAAALLYIACEVWCRWRRWPLVRRDRWHLAGAATLSLLLHIAMDFTNNYGVHPFWPFDNDWRYGDTIFIWEPLLWAAAAPLVFVLRTRLARALVASLLLAAIAACFGSGLVPVGFALLMTTLTGTMLVVGHQAPRRVALVSALAAWLTVTAGFAIARNATEHQVRRYVAGHFPDMTVLDYVLTPMPATAVCWDVMLPMTDANRYVIRHGTWSLWPDVLPVEHCRGRDLFRDVTAPLTPVADEQSPIVLWHGEAVMPRTTLPRLAATHCDAARFMRFARVPWAMQRESTWILGDLRYDREPGLGFAEIELGTDAATCVLPPWNPPRGDLLGE